MLLLFTKFYVLLYFFFTFKLGMIGAIKVKAANAKYLSVLLDSQVFYVLMYIVHE